MRSMTSANLKLEMGLPPMYIEVCGHVESPELSSQGQGYTGWLREDIHDGRPLLSIKTYYAACVSI
ncbi:hypothetical protein DPMN_081643 [Dreissena polymorpha]|uniref:Uncharacterized protein n=1 Tax=Dreissena polymorpha TaxID=45954 RepID=A0A9D3Y5D2_DREPO|nr:hypothetical protein DPMN_081631 [Dreissena polymorpha]KAH3694203.1 hypothetical protein DPMN_081643 [Dreissena polymorpha]